MQTLLAIKTVDSADYFLQKVYLKRNAGDWVVEEFGVARYDANSKAITTELASATRATTCKILMKLIELGCIF
jgi:hypothetical protein